MAHEPTSPEVLVPKPPAAHPAGAGREGSPVAAGADEVAALRSIVEGTARGTGEEFFQSLVRHLASALDVHYAFVAEFIEQQFKARTLAFWARDQIRDNVEFDLAGTPCEDVVRGGLCHHPSGVRAKFPHDRTSAELGVESYLGVPLLGSDGNVLGHLTVFDDRPMSPEPRRLFIFRIFAARAGAELERLRAERERLHAEQRLRESEQRSRDFYEEAPTACTVIGVDGRIQSVNRRAVEWHGYERDELLGMPVLDLHPDTPAGKARAKEAFRKFLAGEEFSGLELETRRKDGRPLWLSIWMKPLRGDTGQIQAAQCITVDITDRVLAEAERARLQQQNLYLQEEIKAAHNFEEIIGHGPALLAVLENVRRVAPTDTSVLLTGETGTGKELIARALHSASKRQDKPLIKINCAALPTGLVESELFGHEQGAFSGAIARRIGRFELADGGTLFLDEIGDIPPEVQVKLLRVLQEREFDRVGGSAPIRVDVRVIAATNRDLLQAVREQKFREDLYYRLNVFPIHLPPLRERREDIPLLVHFLVNKFATRIGKRLDAVGQQTMDRLLAYPWPGNVRELENLLERAVILATAPTLDLDPDSLSARGPAPDAQPRPSLEAVERDYVLTVLQETNWVIDGPRGAARILGLHPNTLRNRLKKLGITRAAHHPW
ncbi:MAG: sigma 54-interacting transcriptional regulator [Gemmataceae bacterium]|nr:sigma 54-interacting transcriptional regulator [Gemmataceae bacterium]